MILNNFEIKRYDFNSNVFNELHNAHYAKDLWPIVYILSDGSVKEAYVGETTDTYSRLSSHLKTDAKSKLSPATASVPLVIFQTNSIPVTTSETLAVAKGPTPSCRTINVTNTPGACRPCILAPAFLLGSFCNDVPGSGSFYP